MNAILDTIMTREFLNAFGITVAIAALLGAIIFIIAAYFVKLKQLEKQLDELQRVITERIDNFEAQTREDFSRERHMINESLSGISENVMRAVISVSGQNDDVQKDDPNKESQDEDAQSEEKTE